MEALGALVARLRLGSTPDLLGQALTHASYAHEHPPARHNETLAFLGDAILGLVVAELLVQGDPAAEPGALTPRRAALVSTPALAGWARRLGIDGCLRLGRGAAQQGGRDRESVLASAFEAVLAAVYLTGGLSPVVAIVRQLMRSGSERASES